VGAVTVPLRPPIAYFGSKVRIAPRIVEYLPPHRGYVEPYCGSLAVLFAKPPTVYECVNDLDGDLVLFWRMLRDRLPDLERVCRLTPHAREEYAQSWPITDDVDDLERARRVWVKLTQGRGGSLRTTGCEEEHRELAAALNACGATVVLSGYPGALYDDLYDGWDRVEIASGTGQNADAGWQLRTEVLWCNRPLARQVGLWEVEA
jgi:hypothetical protein